MNVEKTRTYIQRSRSSPLEIKLRKDHLASYLDNAFPLVIPHLRRLKSLAVYADDLPDVLTHFRCQVPLLEELDVRLSHNDYPFLDSTLFDGDLSSLRKLTLSGVTTHLLWNNTTNLQVFHLGSPEHDVTQLLDFFESAPLLHTVKLMDSITDSSDAPPQRIVPLPHLNTLTIDTDPYSVLLNHLCIPTGASLILGFEFSGNESPLLDCLPEDSANLKNLTHITTINLLFDSVEKFVRLSGPSGSLHVDAYWIVRDTDSYTMDRRILRSLSPSILSTTQRLAISMYRHPNLTENKNPQFSEPSPP